MLIYTGITSGTKLEKIINLNMGIMISSSPTTSIVKDIGKVPCALDNGAFSAFRKGYPFQEDIFLSTLKSAYKNNIKLDFIVCPDIVAGGWRSLEFSKSWANKLIGAPNLALVLQDGMTVHSLGDISQFSYLFVGGTVEWKWKTAESWVEFAKANNKKIHIGQCGKIEYLLKCHALDIDSCDSTSFTINDSFDIIEMFYTLKTPLFNMAV